MPLSNDLEIIASAMRSEVQYLNASRRILSQHHEAVLSAAVAQEYRARFVRAAPPHAFAIVEGYYSDSRTALDLRSTGEPRADVYGWWPNNERFIELKWGWGRTDKRSFLDYYLWPALADIGKLLLFVRPQDGSPASGKRVFGMVAATDDAELGIRGALGNHFRGLPDRETLETQLINVAKGTRYARLPGDVDSGEFRDLWHAMGYLQSIARSLANNTANRCSVEVLQDAAPVPAGERHRYVLFSCRF